MRLTSTAIIAALLLASSAISFAGPQPVGTQAARVALVRRHIKFVFVIYQENRSFDSYFGTFPGADGLYGHGSRTLAGFRQPILNTDGTTATIEPFRIGPRQFAADTDDVDHSHGMTLAKMDVKDGLARMDRFALSEELKHVPSGNPTLAAKQFGELTMAHEDCDTVPFLWLYARRFALFDRIFEEMTGPSTPGNLSIIAAQTGLTQWLLHPDEAPFANGDKGPGVPVLNDADPFWGSPQDPTKIGREPVNANDFPGYAVQRNLTFASLPLTLGGKAIGSVVDQDRDPEGDFADVREDVAALDRGGAGSVPWGWYEEGYDTGPRDDRSGPTDANGRHASYVTHHNGPQYFGYIANNPVMQKHLHGLDEFYRDIDSGALPASGGLFYLKGGYLNTLGLRPALPDSAAAKNFLGDDDHPGYSDGQISEAMVAELVNRIARSRYWKQSAIIITWDDAEGDYDHVPPVVRQTVPGLGIVSDGPRVPLIVISPFGRTSAVVHDIGDQASVVKLANALFGLRSLASLPDEYRGTQVGRERYGQDDLGPLDGANSGVTNLLGAFDADRLAQLRPPVPASQAEIPERLVHALPQQSGYGCRAIGVVPTDVTLHVRNVIPADFNPRPKTQPTEP